MTSRTAPARRGPWLGGLLTLAACLAVLSILSLARSLWTMTYLNVKFVDEVDPFERAVSYYVFVDHRSFAVSVIVVAAATLALLLGMVRVGVRLGAPATILFGVWCGSLTLCAIFPTDNGKTITSASGMVHQVAGAALFVSLPLAGLALARRLTEHEHWVRTARVVRRLGVAAIVVAVTYLATRLPDLVPGLTIFDGRGLSGLVQRLLFGLEIVMLLTLAVHLLRVCVTPQRRAEASG